MSQDVIELNGKRYNAITGAYLGKSHVVPVHISKQFVHGKVIDGFVKPSHPKPVHREPTKETTIAKVEPKPTAVIPKPKPARTPADPVKPHHPERSKTLKQRHDRKPELSLKQAIKTQAPAEIMAKPRSEIMHKRSAYGVDPSRKQRAASTDKHHAVRHFGTPAVHNNNPAHVPVIGVRSAPLQLAARPSQPVTHRPDIFEAAMARATSHEQPAHKVRRRHHGKRHLTNALAIVGAFLVIGGFIGYLNLPGIHLRIASVQAGFSASMPTYAPTGYALEGGVQQTGGIVSLQFRSGSSHYRITQQSSDWNSQTLLDSTLALNGDHKTVQKNGQTIYVYEADGTNAAWVSGGVRYDISGNAELSKDEIASIATSL